MLDFVIQRRQSSRLQSCPFQGSEEVRISAIFVPHLSTIFSLAPVLLLRMFSDSLSSLASLLPTVQGTNITAFILLGFCSWFLSSWSTSCLFLFQLLGSLLPPQAILLGVWSGCLGSSLLFGKYQVSLSSNFPFSLSSRLSLADLYNPVSLLLASLLDHPLYPEMITSLACSDLYPEFLSSWVNCSSTLICSSAPRFSWSMLLSLLVASLLIISILCFALMALLSINT